MPLWVSLLVIFVLFFIGGVFSAAEMALVSLRDSQIEQLARRGKRGKAIEELTKNPNRFLSAVQIGVTLAGFLSSAFGSDSLAGQWVAPAFASWGVPEGLSRILAVIVVTALISFGSIVISELFSKRLALQQPEAFALGLAPIVNAIAKFFRPLIWALGVCTNLLVRLAGFDPDANKEAVSDDELRSMVSNADSLGAEEKHIVDEVFTAGDRTMREVMVPRTEVEFLPGEMSIAEASEVVRHSPHSRYPVIDSSPDRVLGFLHVRDLMSSDHQHTTHIAKLVRPVLRLPQTVRLPRALTDMRRAHSHLAIVLDEYGGTAGIVTLEDLVEELIGDITDEYDVVDDNTRRHRQQRDVDGLTTLEDFGDLTGYELPEGPYDTVAGYFMAQCGQVPQVGDSITVRLMALEPASASDDEDEEEPGDYVQLRVTQMDDRRIAWLSLRVLSPDQVEPEAEDHDPEPEQPATTAATGENYADDQTPVTTLAPDADANAVARLADSLARTQLATGLQRSDEQNPGVIP